MIIVWLQWKKTKFQRSVIYKMLKPLIYQRRAIFILMFFVLIFFSLVFQMGKCFTVKYDSMCWYNRENRTCYKYLSLWGVRALEMLTQIIIFIIFLRPLPTLLGFKAEIGMVIGVEYLNCWANLLKDTSYMPINGDKCRVGFQDEFLSDLVRCLLFASIQIYFSKYKLPQRIQYNLMYDFQTFISYKESCKLYENYLKATDPELAEKFSQEAEGLYESSFSFEENLSDTERQYMAAFEAFTKTVSFKRYSLQVKETSDIEFAAFDGQF